MPSDRGDQPRESVGPAWLTGSAAGSSRVAAWVSGNVPRDGSIRGCCRCSPPGRISRFAAPELLNFSAMITRGTSWRSLRRLRKTRLAACMLRRLRMRRSSTLPSCSTARPRACFWPLLVRKTRVHLPCVATTRAATTPFMRRGLSTRQTLLPDRFRTHHDPALRQKLFHILRNSARKGKTTPQRE